MLSKAQLYWLRIMSEYTKISPFTVWRSCGGKITVSCGQGEHPRCTTFNKLLNTGMISRCLPLIPEQYIVTPAGRAALEAEGE